MKQNGIIYPNTPYFQRFGSKMRIPAGVEDVDFELFAGILDEEGLKVLACVAISASELDGIAFEIDGNAGGEVISLIVDENLIAEFALAGVTIPESYIGMNAALVQSEIDTGEHTITATLNGVSKSVTIEVE